MKEAGCLNYVLAIVLHSHSINEANTGASVITTGLAHSLCLSVGKSFGKLDQIHPVDYNSISLSLSLSFNYLFIDLLIPWAAV